MLFGSKSISSLALVLHLGNSSISFAINWARQGVQSKIIPIFNTYSRKSSDFESKDKFQRWQGKTSELLQCLRSAACKQIWVLTMINDDWTIAINLKADDKNSIYTSYLSSTWANSPTTQVRYEDDLILVLKSRNPHHSLKETIYFRLKQIESWGQFPFTF